MERVPGVETWLKPLAEAHCPFGTEPGLTPG